VYDKREDDRLDAPSLTDIVVVVMDIGLLHLRDYIRIGQSECESVLLSCANIRCDDSDGHDTEDF
jgi:hypothetical protein